MTLLRCGSWALNVKLGPHPEARPQTESYLGSKRKPGEGPSLGGGCHAGQAPLTVPPTKSSSLYPPTLTPPTPATRSPSAFVMPVPSLVWPHSFLKSSPPSSGSAAARMTKAEMGLHRSDPIKSASCPAPLTQILHLPPAPPLLPPARPSLRHLVQPGLCERLCRERSA